MNNILFRLSVPVFFLLASVANNALALDMTEAELKEYIKNLRPYGGPVTTADDSEEISSKLNSCFSVGLDTMRNIDALVSDPGTDLNEEDAAQEKIRLPVDHALLICGNARQALEKGNYKDSYLLDWVKQQERGWRTTRSVASRTAMHISRFNYTVHVWENSWIPKLRAKKKKFREIGTNISKDYNELLAMSQRGQFDDAFKTKLSQFRTTVNTAKTLQMTMVDLRKFVIKNLKEANPKNEVNKVSYDPIKLMSSINKESNNNMWLDSAEIWREKMTHANVEMIIAYAKLEKNVKSLQQQTIFRSHGKPLQGIKFTEIHHTFKDLYDELSKNNRGYQK